MHRKKSKHSKNHNVVANDNVSYINARRTKPKFNHEWNDTNKKRFNSLTNNKPNTQIKNGVFSNVDFTNTEKIINLIIEQFKAKDLDKLHRIDEKILEDAIIHNRKDLVELSIVAYSFRKLLSKKHIFNNPNWASFEQKTISNLVQAIELSKKENKEEYNNKIKEIQEDIEKTDQLLGHFIHDIVFNARIKLASTVYAYGLSLSQAANLLSANKDDVMEIIGQTKISDEDTRSKTISQRVDFLKKNTTKVK